MYDREVYTNYLSFSKACIGVHVDDIRHNKSIVPSLHMEVLSGRIGGSRSLMVGESSSLPTLLILHLHLLFRTSRSELELEPILPPRCPSIKVLTPYQTAGAVYQQHSDSICTTSPCNPGHSSHRQQQTSMDHLREAMRRRARFRAPQDSNEYGYGDACAQKSVRLLLLFYSHALEIFHLANI